MKRIIENINKIALNDRLVRDLPLDYAYKNVRVVITGILTVGVAAATLLQDGILNLFPEIRIKATGIGMDGEPISVDAFQLVKENWFRNKSVYILQPGPEGAGGLTVAAHPFYIELLMPLNFQGTALQNLSALNAPKLSSLQLIIRTGVDTDVSTPGGGGTSTIGTLTIQAVSEEIPGVPANELVPHRLMNQLAINQVIAGASNYAERFEIKGSGYLKSIMFETEAPAGTNSDGLIGKIGIFATLKKSDGSSGDTVQFGETTFAALRAENQAIFGVGVDGLTNPAFNAVGFAIWELDETLLMNKFKMLRMDAYSKVSLKIEYLAAGALWVTTEFAKEV